MMAPFILLVLLLGLPSADAFAAGGFGGKKKPLKSKKKKPAKIQPTVNLFTPEGRIEHIRSRINVVDFSPLTKLVLKKL